jgi:predicted amidohydrolase
MIIFQPGRPRQIYSKEFIHADEERYFIANQNSSAVLPNYPNIALAICYEISIPQHAERAYKNGAEIYLASVAKFVTGIDKSLNRLSEIASVYSMAVIMSNCVGIADGSECAGRTAVWNNQGQLLAQLNDTDEGIIIFDTGTQEIIIKTIQ